jgi:transcriptional regulator with XRE-family HTH domain
MVKSPSSLDEEIGRRLRTRRVLIGMTQEGIAEALGITFQQVQKYEKGTNRISASRLLRIAEVLGTGVGYFYDGMCKRFSTSRRAFESCALSSR